MKEHHADGARRGSRRWLVLVAAAVGISLLSSATTVFASQQFSDVPASNPFKDDISWAADNGIVNGFPDGTYHPADPVTRQAMAAFLHRLSGQGSVAPSVNAAELGGKSLDDLQPLWALVGSTGALDASSGDVTGVVKLAGLGNYEVDFDRNVSACAFVATIGPSGGGSATGEVNVADRSGNVNAVFVDTNNSSGAATDLPFHLVVFC